MRLWLGPLLGRVLSWERVSPWRQSGSALSFGLPPWTGSGYVSGSGSWACPPEDWSGGSLGLWPRGLAAPSCDVGSGRVVSEPHSPDLCGGGVVRREGGPARHTGWHKGSQEATPLVGSPQSWMARWPPEPEGGLPGQWCPAGVRVRPGSGPDVMQSSARGASARRRGRRLVDAPPG